ncbi:Transmembrane protein [Trema orientale]|uniref:Transmembrane protein n=1 Tax=Trema orientale TaxID=63057 RepID=A0A2P5CPF1_TREOI|nr:Transmembrane protein [Trema orientale]
MNSRLYQAVVSGDEATLEDFSSYTLLLEETPKENTVLHVAVLHKQRRVVEKLLQSHESLLYRKNSDGDTSLHLAAKIGSHDLAKILIDQETKAARREVRFVVRGQRLGLRLQGNGVKLEDSELASLKNSAGESSLFHAVERKFFDIAKHLLLETRKCSIAGRNGMNALHAAVIHLYKDTNFSGNESEQLGATNSVQLLGKSTYF